MLFKCCCLTELRNGLTLDYVQESIATLRDQGHDVYLAALDSRKAFDTVWHHGLFLKLYQAGMN